MEKANVIFNALCEHSLWRCTLMAISDAMVPWRLVVRSDGMKMEAVGIELMDTLTFVELKTGVAVDGLYLSDIPDAIKIGEYYTYDIQSLLNDEL